MVNRLITDNMVGGSYYYKSLKDYVYILDRGVCHICNRYVSKEKSVLDHIIPKIHSQDTNEYWNIRIAHKKCNSKRGAAKIAGQLRLPIKITLYYGDNEYAMS